MANRRTSLVKDAASFRFLFGVSPLPMWIYDLDTLRVIEVNDAAIAQYGYARDEFLGMRMTDLQVSGDASTLRDAAGARPSRAPVAREWQFRRKSGEVISTSITVHALEFAGRSSALAIEQRARHDMQAEASLEGEIRARVALMDRLVSLSESLTRPLSVGDAVAAIGEGALSLSAANRAAVYVRGPDGTTVCPWSHGLSGEYIARALLHMWELPEGRLMDQPDSAADEGAEEIKPFVLTAVQGLPPEALSSALARTEGYAAIGHWPLSYEGRVIAVVTCCYDTPHTWSRVEREVFGAFCWEAAAALQNARLYEAQTRRMLEMEAVIDLGERLRAAHTPEEMHPIIVAHARALLTVDHASLVLRDANRETLTCVCVQGIPAEGPSTVALAESLPGWVVQTGVAYIAEDLARELLPTRMDTAAYHAFGPMLIAPVRSEQEVTGALVLARARTPHQVPFGEDEIRLSQGIAAIAGTAIRRASLHENLEQAYIQMVLALAQTIESRDVYTAEHSARLVALAELVARELHCTQDQIEDIRWAARLHDIGKVGVPDEVLGKPQSLTASERAVMQRHPVIGEEILRLVDRMQGVAKLIRHHQERWDGTGYPDGLAEAEIPLGARILAVVDAYGAMTEDRPYRKARTHDAAVAELRRCAGTQFDPDVVDAFCRCANRSERDARAPR
jgi:PAS domain S-box-containing protein/putative nucleotidyltransferase with HDIG domain